MSEGARIEYFFSVVSPWAYLGHAELVRIARAHHATIVYRPVSLARVFPSSGGVPLAKRHPLRQRHRMLELQRWRDKRGVPLVLHPPFWPFDTVLADRLVTVLAAHGGDVEAFLPAAFKGVWRDGLDLADEATLRDLLRKGGLDPALVDAAKSDATAALYDAAYDDAMAKGVFGSPCYIREGEVFWGQDRLAFLGEALASGRPAFSPDA